jgi:hypothetical protein
VSADEFPVLFERFKAMLEPYLGSLHVSGDGPTMYSVDTAPPETRSPATWFAATRLGKRYVSYYLMPVYALPELTDAISPTLRKRRQGKSCFNLATVDEALLAELAQLTADGFARTVGDPTWVPVTGRQRG